MPLVEFYTEKTVIDGGSGNNTFNVRRAVLPLEIRGNNGADAFNLGDGAVYPIAEALAARGVPFVFVTGYDAENIDTRYANVPVLQKPIEREVLQGLFVSSVKDGGKPAWHVSVGGLAAQNLAVASAPER